MVVQIVERIRLKLAEDKDFAELIKGSGTALILRIVGIASGYVFTLLVTRTLGAKAWGIFALSLVVLQIASVIGRLGMDTALLRFTAEYVAKGEITTLKEIYKKALILVVPCSILVAISVYFLSPILADRVFHKPYLTNYFRIVSFVIVPFVLLWVHSESIRGLKRIKEYMFLQQSGIFIVASLLFLVGLSFIKSHFFPLISYGLSILTLSIISIYLWRKYFTNPFITSKTSTVSTTSYKSLLSISIPMLLSSSLSLIMGWTDTIMLGMFRSAQEVGVYNVALKVSMITSFTLGAINTIAAPKFAELWGKRDIKGLARVAQQSTKLIFWTSFPVLPLFLIFPKPILGIFGEEFKVGAVALMILTLGQFVNAAAGSVGYILQMTGHQKFYQNVVLIGTVLNIVLNWLLIPIYGVVGASIATSITVIFGNVLSSIFIRRNMKIKTYINLRCKRNV